MGGDDRDALRRLIDKDEIIDLVHRYSYCVDHKLYDELAELFTDDCVVDYGPGVAPPVVGRAAFREMLGHPDGGFAATSHHNANIFVTFVDNDHASVRTSLYAWHQRDRRHDAAVVGLLPRHGGAGRRPDGRSPRGSCGSWASRAGTSSGIRRSTRPTRSRSLRAAGGCGTKVRLTI